MKILNIKKVIQTVRVISIVTLLASCGENPTARIPTSGTTVSPSTATATPAVASVVKYKQIERLGRPAINEGLVITNAFLNAFNSIGPSLDLSSAAAPVVAEAAGVLTAVYNYGVSKGLTPPTVANVAAGFLPDVMRIDISKKVNVGQWAYNSDLAILNGTTGGAMLTGGRKLEDDVMDITLSYLIAGNPACGPGTACGVPDGVSYEGGTNCANAGQGSNVANPGHKCLFAQSSRNGSSRFPFLAEPN